MLHSIRSKKALLPWAILLAFGLLFTGVSAIEAHAEGTSIHVGGGAGFKPKYEGSDEYDAVGFPLIIPEFGQSLFDGRLDFRGVDDVRLEILRTNPSGRPGFVAGPVLGYRFEREQTDGRLLLGLGDIDAGLVAGGFIGFRLGAIDLDAAYKHHFDAGDNAGLIDVSLSTKTPVSNYAVLDWRIGTTYANDEYMQTFFGVTAAQSTTSVAGLRAFNADDGLKDVYFQLGAKVNLSDRWTLRGNARYARLIGDAADSPIVESEDQFSGGLGLTYRFDLHR